MSIFASMDVGRTGAGFAKYWMDTVAHNVANANTVRGTEEEPFKARLVVARTLGGQIAPTGSGVAVGGVVETRQEAPREYLPDHPLADEDGYVTSAAVDLGTQLVDLIVAQRSYQANLRSITSAQEAYQSALRIGQG